LGIRFNWLLLFGQSFPEAKLVRVDIDATEIDRNRLSDTGLVGDVGLTLRGLNKLVEKKDHSAWRAALKESYQPMIEQEIEARENPSDPVHPFRLVEKVRQAVGDKAIYVIDGGDTSYYGNVGLRAQERASVLPAASGQLGCMGTGIPFAIAAKAARPEKTVVVISGDGSFGLNAMEFCTAVRHNLPIVCVVNNDKAWGMIKHGQELCYGNERTTGTELGAVHYERVVEALGGYGELVEKDEDIIPAVERALASGKPACVNVMTDPCIVSPATLLFREGLNIEE
jgi:acetolactate synthase-1/2/3 large subunit